MASSVEKRMARALPVLRIDRLASVMSIFSASSVRVIRRWWSSSSSLTTIAISDGPFEVFAHQSAFREHSREDEGQDHTEPAVDRKSSIEVKRKLLGRDRLADAADDGAQELKGKQRPGNRLQAIRVDRNERIASAYRLHHPEQPRENEVVERNGDEPETRDRAQAGHDRLRFRSGRDLDCPPEPRFVDEGERQETEDGSAVKPVEDDKDTQRHKGDQQRGCFGSRH